MPGISGSGKMYFDCRTCTWVSQSKAQQLAEERGVNVCHPPGGKGTSFPSDAGGSEVSSSRFGSPSRFAAIDNPDDRYDDGSGPLFPQDIGPDSRTDDLNWPSSGSNSGDGFWGPDGFIPYNGI